MRFDRFHEAYLATLDTVGSQPQFRNAPRGHQSRERLNYQFSLANPAERICYLASRRTNIVFNFAEALWYLSARDDLDFIGYYNRKMREYSMNGQTLTGTAYGPKIFRFGTSQVNQWQRIAHLLGQDDPDSKRAFIQIFDANEELGSTNIDVSCTLGLQFFVREQKLYAIAYMRANDAFRGMVSDVFSFTFMQELLARELGLELGDYYHVVGSVHIYQPDDEAVERVLAEAASGTQGPRDEFPVMPSGNPWPYLETVLEYETLLREDRVALSGPDIEALDLPVYWQQVLLLFSFYQSVAYRRPADASVFRALCPLYQRLLHHKWPQQATLSLLEHHQQK
ncbi:thymidylate synthase [Paenibacillus thiaminolyticus]|nr:thymidylate synthase [Paenibacillus thiaminolyticus]